MTDIWEYIKLNEDSPVFQIKIPKSVWKHFWEEPPEGHVWEFWAFRTKPNVKPGEKIQFTFEGRPVAEVTTHLVEEPGKSECEQTGKFKNKWKVWWNLSTFKDLREAGD